MEPTGDIVLSAKELMNALKKALEVAQEATMHDSKGELISAVKRYRRCAKMLSTLASNLPPEQADLIRGLRDKSALYASRAKQLRDEVRPENLKLSPEHGGAHTSRGKKKTTSPSSDDKKPDAEGKRPANRRAATKRATSFIAANSASFFEQVCMANDGLENDALPVRSKTAKEHKKRGGHHGGSGHAIHGSTSHEILPPSLLTASTNSPISSTSASTSTTSSSSTASSLSSSTTIPISGSSGAFNPRARPFSTIGGSPLVVDVNSNSGGMQQMAESFERPSFDPDVSVDSSFESDGYQSEELPILST